MSNTEHNSAHRDGFAPPRPLTQPPAPFANPVVHDRRAAPEPPRAEPSADQPVIASSEGLAREIDVLLDADGSIVAVIGRDQVVREANPAALRAFGAASLDDLNSCAESRSILRSLLDHAPCDLLATQQSQTWHGDFDLIDSSGKHRVFQATVAARPAQGSSVSGQRRRDDDGYLAVIAHEVTAARQETDQLRQRATHDPLTGLSNRRRIESILEHAIAEQRGAAGHVAVLFVDLDRLKYVNDVLGHGIGDRLLVSTAERLLEAVRAEDHVARIGGDEFLVVCRNITDENTATLLSERIRESLAGRLRVRDLDVEFSVSVGIALTDCQTLGLADSQAATALIRDADTAMYEAKRTGRGRSVMFTPAMRIAARERVELAEALAVAVSHGELMAVYRPMFSPVARNANDAEALLRWNHPTRGRIDTAALLAVAEESGIIGRLGEFLLRSALRDLRGWIDLDLVDDRFQIHVGATKVELGSASFVTHVRTMLAEFQLEPRRLVLEVRDTELHRGNADVQRSVRALRQLGVGIAVDQIELGTIGLSALNSLGATHLKVDATLVQTHNASDHDVRVLRALVLLAHALEMSVIAERVTTLDQLTVLETAGCDLVQGGLLGDAQPNDNIDPAPTWPLG